MPFAAFFAVPNAATLIASTTEYASPLFTEYSSLIFGIALGLPVAVLGTLWLIRSINKATRRVLGGKRGRGGRRGRRR